MRRYIVLLLLAVFPWCAVVAQTSAGGPAFDAATVKPSKGRGLGGRALREDPGRLAASNVTLFRLIEHAYSIENYQLSGGPSWLNSEFYDVDAVAGRSASPAELRSMLQKLLAERFHLVVRREVKEMPVYALVAAKNGPKLRERKEAAGQEAVQSEPGRMRFRDLPPLASFLSGFAERPVIDATGLSGDFDIVLEVGRQRAGGESVPSGPSEIGAAMAEFSQNVLQMVQDQLGLKAEARKAPMETLVVESAERPASLD